MISASYLQDQGYTPVRQLPDGSWAGLTRLLYTTGLCLGLSELGHQRRFCYGKEADALKALNHLQSASDEPTGWIARRPEVVAGDGLNPPQSEARPTRKPPRPIAPR